MFRDIIPGHRHATPLSRAVAAMPAVPHPHVPHRHHKRRRFGTGALVRSAAGLVAVLVGTGGVILREKLVSIVRRKGAATDKPADKPADEGVEE